MALRVNTSERRAAVPVIVTDGSQSSATWSLNTGGLAPTGYTWRAGGTPTGDITATPPALSGYIGQVITCDVTTEGGTITTPGQKVHMTHADASHSMMDDMVLALVPHEKANYIARQSGNWADASTWHGGQVPGEWANVLIPDGMTVTYNHSGARRNLATVRVDGKLDWPRTTDHDMYVGLVVVTQNGEWEDGQPEDRSAGTHTVTFVDRDPRRDQSAANNLDLRRDPALMGRGFLCIGTVDIWAKDRKAWMPFRPVTAGATQIEIVDRTGFGQPALFTGLEIGDTLLIGGTRLGYVGGENPLLAEDEEVTVSDIATASGGTVVTFSPALSNAHNDYIHNRLDAYPAAMVKGGGNVTFISEGSATRQRAHFMIMHMAAECDIWGGVDFINLGRTSKRERAGKVSGGRFLRSRGTTLIETLDLEEDSNIIGRYDGPHFHFMGGRSFVDANSKRREVHDIYVSASTGWGIVHHACHMRFFGNAITGAFGAAFVAEQGSETGPWVETCVIGTSNDPTTQPADTGERANWQNQMKIDESGGGGLTGDFARYGIGLALRSRAIRNSLNVIHSVGYGIEGWSRASTNPAVTISESLNPLRADIDWKYAALTTQIFADGETLTDMFHRDVPIQLGANTTIACVRGIEITKDNANHSHDVGITWNNHRAYGMRIAALDMEYILGYMVHFADVAAEQTGFRAETNTWSAGGWNTQTVTLSSGTGMTFSGGGDTADDSDFLDSADNPRWYNVGQQHAGSARPHDGDIRAANTENTRYTDVLYEDPDWQNTLIDEGRDPSFAAGAPDDFGEMDGVTGGTDGTYARLADNTNALKEDNVSTAATLLPSTYFSRTNGGNLSFFGGATAGRRARKFWENFGHYKVGGTDKIAYPYMLGDRITGRPALYLKFVRATSVNAFGGAGSPNYNGILSINPTPVTAADVTAVCAIGGSVALDVTSGASGASGSFSSQDLYSNRNVKSPEHGELSWSGDTVTYTPDPDFEGADKFFVMIYSDGRYKTRQYNVLVGTDAPLVTPVSGTHFSIVGGAGQITFRLGQAGYEKPPVRSRKARIAQYSTDNGTTWRRLCYWWAQTDWVVTAGSDGAALSAGSYDCQVRYITDHDKQTSTASVNQSISVT